MRISDWSSDVCSSDLGQQVLHVVVVDRRVALGAVHLDRDRHVACTLRQQQPAAQGDALALERGVGDVEGALLAAVARREGRRVGNACVCTGQSRSPPDIEKKITHKRQDCVIYATLIYTTNI